MNKRQSVSVVRVLIMTALLAIATAASAEVPPGYREREARLKAAMTEGDIKLMQDTHDTYKAAMAEYFDGNTDRAIPLLLRLADLEARQKVAMTAWFERAGFGSDLPEMDVLHLQNLAVTHGRLARVYYLAGKRGQCTAHLSTAVSLGQELVAKADRSELVDFATVAREPGLHSPDPLFDAVRKRDEQERPGAAYVPAKADCVR